MEPTRALYSVIQYVPDGGRAEAANAGVVLYVPSRRWLEVRVSSTFDRVRQFFKPDRHQIRRIESAVDSLKHRLELAREQFIEESDLAQFAAARADAVRLTAPRLVIVEEPLNDLHGLYEELVGDRERALANEAQGSSLPAAVAEVFGRLEAQHRVWRPGRIKLPMVNRDFDVPIAYVNGRVNYVRPESLAPGGKVNDRMARLGFNGQLIFNHLVDGRDSHLVVLSTDPDADPDAEQRYERTLKEFNTRFIPHDKAAEFAAEVEATAR